MKRTLNTITYKGEEYPFRTFRVMCEGEEKILDISTETLQQAMEDEVGEYFWEGEREGMIDSDVYYYLDVDYFHNSAKDICENYLDVSMEFIEELF